MLMPIGVFSQMTRLSVRTLRRYADSGLLVPAEVDSGTGYRYYAPDQAARAEVIRSLREVGMSLDAIAEVLSDSSPEGVQHRLEQHQIHLADELRRHEHRLERTRRLISGEEELMFYEITPERIDDRTVIARRRHATAESIAEVISSGFAEVVASAPEFVAPPFVVFHDIIDESTDGDVEVCLPVPAETAGATVLPGGPVVSTVHQGPYETIAPAYHALTRWMREHGHSPAGPVREIYLNDPTTVDPDAIRTRVEWPITGEED